MGQPMFWLKGIHFVPFHLLKNVVILKRNSFNNYLMLICTSLGCNYYILIKREEEGSLMSPSFKVGVFGEGAKLKPGTPYLQALKNSLGKTLSQSKLLLLETEVVSFTVKNPTLFSVTCDERRGFKSLK